MTTFSKVVLGLAAVLTFLILCSHAQVVSSPTAGRSMVEALKESSRLQYELIHKHYDNALEEMLTVEDIDAINPITGRTALGVACADESADAIDMVKPLVLTYRADVTLADAIGSTPLHYAARAGNLAVVQFLIDNGADVHAENIMGQTPLYSALERKRVRIAKILKDYGARELDEDATIELHASIALQEAMAAVQRRTGRGASGANVQEAFRDRITSSFTAASEALLSDGKVAEAQLLQSVRERLIDIVDSTPRDDGMSSMEWVTLFASKAGAAVGVARSGSGVAPTAAPKGRSQ